MSTTVRLGNLSLVIKASLASIILFVLSVQTFGQLVHPGISHKRSDLDRMRSMVQAGVEPWAESFEILRQHRRAQHDCELDVLDQDPSFVTEYSDASDRFFINDGTTAYYNALMWYITQDERHAEKAIEIFNAYKGLRRNSTGIPLRSGRIWRIIEAAEIIAHTYDGWDPNDMQEFKDMLVFPGYSATTVPTQAIQSDNFTFYWHVYNGDPARHGNQGLFAMRTMMAMGIFLDNEVMYQRALRYLQGQTHREDDLPYPSGPSINNNEITECEFFDEFTQNGFSDAIPDYGFNEVVSNYIFENGQSQESSRDQAHAVAGVTTIQVMSEMAWNQGDNLYGHLDNRPLLGMEFTLRYNLSGEFPFLEPTLQPWEPTIESGEYIARTDRSGRWCARIINPGVNCDQDNVTRGGDNFSPLYEMSLAHYRDRIGLPSSDFLWLQRGHDLFTDLVGVETEGVVTDHPVWGSLAFRRVSPGDPISGFDSDGLPQYAMNELPMTIEAENFDFFPIVAAQRASFDNTFLNQGFTYRFDSNSDVFQSAEGGHHIGNTDDGEFLTYTVSVPQTGIYEIQARASANNNASSVMFSIDGQDITGQVAIPNTGGPQNWQTFSAGQEISLTQGVHQLKVDTFGSFNLDNFTFVEILPPSVDLSVAPGIAIFAPRVSNNDLAQTAFLSSSSSLHDELFNGQVGNDDADTNDAGEIRLSRNNLVTINFDTSVNTAGYDITQIDSVFGWDVASGGRANQGYSIRFDLVDGSSIEEPGQHWQPNNPVPFYWTTVSFTDASGGVIVSGVESITFQITEEANAGGFVIAREIDIFGAPTGGEILLGDANQDGTVDFLDIATFVEFLQSGVYLAEADCNQDGVVDFSDIPSFIEILSSQ